MINKQHYTYRVNIIPIGSYYFGGERTFNPADGSRANYFAKGRTIPQQTTILGMLRFALLKKFITTTTETPLSVDELIGSHGFNGSKTSYGIIQNISPLFLQYKNQCLELAGMDWQIYDTGFQKFKFEKTPIKSYLDKVNTKPENIKKFIPQVLNYNHKKFMYNVWRNNNSPEKSLISEDEIFIPDVRPGNKKSQAGGVSEKAYYKQERFRLKKGYSFAVYLTSSQELIVDNNNSHSFLIPIGGDNTECRVDISKIEEGENHFTTTLKEKHTSDNQQSIRKIILLSDAFIPHETLRKVDFSINFLSEFRYIQTTNTHANIAQIQKYQSQNTSLPKKSNLLFLLSRGSVLYVNSGNLQNVITELEGNDIYRSIGYNYFRTEIIT
ncbi:MAG: type III-B CRISPR module-associated Cmr3 family protein [bacterium]